MMAIILTEPLASLKSEEPALGALCGGIAFENF
jgi:hypothetical protein